MVTRNVSGQSGGGIENASYLEVTQLSVLDSSIDSNRSTTGTGGGIDNFGGNVIVSGSTISGNSVPSLGGGVNNVNNSGVVTITNSTISGNSSGSEGAGIFNSHLVDLNVRQPGGPFGSTGETLFVRPARILTFSRARAILIPRISTRRSGHESTDFRFYLARRDSAARLHRHVAGIL
ncbi:MAG: hypothetical protein ACRETU_14180 [Steroidobacterales bacterium]